MELVLPVRDLEIWAQWEAHEISSLTDRSVEPPKVRSHAWMIHLSLGLNRRRHVITKFVIHCLLSSFLRAYCRALEGRKIREDPGEPTHKSSRIRKNKTELL